MKVILNEKDLLEQELEQAKNIVKSKTLTKDLIEKLDKCKTKEELKVTLDLIDSMFLELDGRDNNILFSLSNKKIRVINKINENNNYNLVIDSFYKGLIKKRMNLEKLDYIANYKKVFKKDLNLVGSSNRKKFYKELESLKTNIEKSKTLTNDLVEKIDKCKTNEELRATCNEIKPKLQDLNNEDTATLNNKIFEKINLIYEENK